MRLVLAGLLWGAACLAPAPPAPPAAPQLGAHTPDTHDDRELFVAACRSARERAARPYAPSMAEQVSRITHIEAAMEAATEGVVPRALARYRDTIAQARAPLDLGAHRGWTRDAELRAAAEQLSGRLAELAGTATRVMRA